MLPEQEFHLGLQQSLPFTECAEGCETAEEQSDDEVRTSQVPERREGKTKVTKDYIYCLWHLSNFIYWSSLVCLCFAITPSTCSIYQLNRIKPRVNHFDLLGVLCLSFIEYIHGHFFYILKM